MIALNFRRFQIPSLLMVAMVAAAPTIDIAAAAADDDKSNTAIANGQRIATAGHSFQMFVPDILADIAEKAGIKDHKQVARQGIGGSYVHQHWDRPEEENTIKQALKTGKIDVLSLSPIYLPDDGIENFAELAVEHNPDIRVGIQEFWLPYDVYAKNFKRQRPAAIDRNARTVKEMREMHAEYFQSIDGHVQRLNKKLGKNALFVVPAGQAVILLREKIIAGEAPGLREQEDLFRDAIGHPNPPLRALVAYCHFAAIYRRSPEGLAVPDVLGGEKSNDETKELNRLLQELAWQAVREHPLSRLK